MRSLVLALLSVFLFPAGGSSQGLFEAARANDQNDALPFNLSGYGRGLLYLGESTPAMSSEIRSGYGEAALKIDAFSGKHGGLFSEFRFRSGYEYGEQINEFQLREAYADIYLGNFELRAGQAMMAWGRADALNPTNNLTPRDYFVRSPVADDMRLGNFLMRGRYTVIPQLRLEAVWVPVYRYSIYRFDLFEMPDFIRFSQSPLPGATLDNGSFAAKIDFLFNRFDGSLSWFNGYDPMPGIQAGDLPGSPTEEMVMDMYSRAFRQHTLGLDFSFGLGSFGVRGEAAFRGPTEDYRDQVFAPSPDLRYVLEAERSLGNFSLMLMYQGHYVLDFKEIPVEGGIPEIDPVQLQDPLIWAGLGAMMSGQMEKFNRIIFDQTREFSHTLGIRPALEILHGVSVIELFGLYNFSTGEWGLFPKICWDASDNLKLSLGAQYLEGSTDTRYELIAPVFNGGFFELRYSF